MIELTLRVECTCGSVSGIAITESAYTGENEVDLSTSIEHYSAGLFYCQQNNTKKMKINCTTCGNDIYLQC